MRLFHKIGLTVSLGAALSSGAALAQQQQFINVLTGGQSGVYYPVGVALSQIFAKDIPNVRATAQVTKASAENLNLLQAGRGELAIALGGDVDLLDLRAASTVMQYQVITTGQCLWAQQPAAGLFECFVLSEKLDFDAARAGLLADIAQQGKVYAR